MLLKCSWAIGLLPTSSTCRPPGWTSKPARLIKPYLKGLYGLKRSDCSPFAIRRAPLRGTGLNGPHQVERDNAEHLPGAIGVIALRRQAIEREAALELTVDLLVGAPSAHEVP